MKFDGKKDADVTDNNTHLKALDFGGDILAGYKTANGVFVSLGYTLVFLISLSLGVPQKQRAET